MEPEQRSKVNGAKPALQILVPVTRAVHVENLSQNIPQIAVILVTLMSERRSFHLGPQPTTRGQQIKLKPIYSASVCRKRQN